MPINTRMNYLVLGLLLFISSCDFFKLSISSSLDSPQTCKTQKALTQNEIQERLIKMRLNRKDRGFICLANSDIAGFYISQANVDRQVIKFLGFLGTDGLLAHIGQTEDELFTVTGFDSWDRLLHLGSDTGAMDPLAPMHLNWANVDISNANFNSMNIMETDLREVEGLSVKMLNELYRFDGAKLPAIDAKGWIATDKDLSRMDLSLVKGLSVGFFDGIAKNSGLIFPQMDLSGNDVSGKDVTDFDLSLTTGLSVSQLNSMNSRRSTTRS